MKNFALKYPFAASVLVFFTILIGGTIASVILGVLMMGGDCKPISPADPCDAGPMAAIAIWTLGFSVSLVLGVLAATATFAKLKREIKTKEVQSYK